MPGHDIVVLGASAGGVESLATLVRALPEDLAAAVFVVLHVAPRSTSVLPRILNRASPLRAAHAVEGEPIEYGRIYVAPPDMHMLLRRGTVHLSRGPKENSARPAVDPTMRTAAHAYGPRVVGVVLSGNLDDGTAGLLKVMERGGVTIAQDPDEALFPGMPRSAVDNAGPAHVLPLGMIAPLLVELAATPVEEGMAMSDELDEAFDLAEGGATPANPEGGSPSPYTCPECHGTLWEVHEGELMRFRCRVGHRYSAETLMAEQGVALEAALWTALRSLEESAALTLRLAERARLRGQRVMVTRFTDQAADIERRAEVIRRVLATEDEPHGTAAADTGAASPTG